MFDSLLSQQKLLAFARNTGALIWASIQILLSVGLLLGELEPCLFQEGSCKSRMGVSENGVITITIPHLRLFNEKFDDNNALWITYTLIF